MGLSCCFHTAPFVLRIKQEVHHVAVFDDICFAFGLHLARFFGTLFAAKVTKSL